MPTTDKNQNRYWGWGYQNHEYDPHKASLFLHLLAQRFALNTLAPKQIPPTVEQFSIPKTKLSEEFIARWKERGLSLKNEDRLFHAAGKSYRDLIRIRTNTLARFPDGVLFLQDAKHLDSLFVDAKKLGITLIPFGGGSGVVGGTECVGPVNNTIVVVDVTKLDRLLSIDHTARTVRAQAGIFGPKLENELNRQGYTLGHFPQSFEFSTLGGWLATRSAGQNSTKYGKIENMVQSLVIHTPKGVIETHQVPASATGPSLKHLLLGSEGIYGIITEAVLKIHPLPQSQKFSCAFFENFEQGLTCVRTIMQADITPSVVRLSDADETSFFLDLMLSKKWQKKLLPHWFNFKGLGNHPCFMLIASEGQTTHTNFHLDKIRSLIRSTHGKLVPRKFAAKWKKDRFELPYLRDNLMDHGFFIDTLETAAPWSKLLGIYESMKLAFFEQKSHQLLMACHLSHAYKDGASLYFTFMGVQKRGHEIAQWEEIKDLATNVIMSQGGTLSHHHGVGYDHKKWMVQEETPVGIEVLKAIKKELDPEGLLNPGKVV